jgi:ketosteroid isomerase-like protein
MRITPIIAAALVLAACAPKPETPEQTAARLKAETDSARVAIEAQDARAVRFIAAAEPDSLASIYTEDAVAFWMDYPATRGRAAIASKFRTFMATGSLTYKVTTTSVEASGSIAVETGHTDATFTPGPKAPHGTKAGTTAFSYVTIWRKTGRQWLVSRDIPVSGEPEQLTPAKQD